MAPDTRDIQSIATAEGDTPKDVDPADMMESATQAANLLKALAHPGRLMILCHLASDEKSVTEMEHLLGWRQAAVSQQLARLRLDGLVSPRREGKTIFYSLADPRAARIVALMYEMYCDPDTATAYNQC